MLVEAGAGRAELRSLSPDRSHGMTAPAEQIPSRAVVVRRPQARWIRRYRLVLIVLDVVTGLGAGLIMSMVRPGEALPTSPYAWMCLALPVVWLMALGFRGAYAPKYF